MLYALINTEVPLNKGAFRHLVSAAMCMVENGRRSHKLCHDDLMGTITTDFEVMTFGKIVGYGFRAEAVTPKGVGMVYFVIQAPMTEEAAKSGILRWYNQAHDLSRSKTPKFSDN